MAVYPGGIVIDGTRYVIDMEQGGQTIQSDLAQQSSRDSDGESDAIRFDTESNHAISDWSGGAGQARHVAAASYLTGLGDGSWAGYFYPPRTELTGGKSGTHLFSLSETVHSAADLIGTPDQDPVVSGSGHAYYTTGGNMYRFDGANSTNVTPPGHRAVGAAVLGRQLFCFAEQQRATSIMLERGSWQSAFQSSDVYVTWGTDPSPGNTLVAVIMWVLNTDEMSEPVVEAPAGWVSIARANETNTATPAQTLGYEAFVIEPIGPQGFAAARKNGELFRLTNSSGDIITDGVSIWASIMEFSGLAPGDSVIEVDHEANLASTTVSTEDIDSDLSDGSLQVAVIGYMDSDNADDLGTQNGWVEIDETTVVGNTISARVQFSWSTNSTVTERSETLPSAKDITNGIIIAFAQAQSTTIDPAIILASADNGESWLAAPANYSTNVIGTPRQVLASQNSLFFTTEQGLFRMRYAEQEFNDGTRTINIAVIGPLHGFIRPVGNMAGNFLASWDRGIFYNYGASLWRWTEGGGAEQVWPTPGWATVADTITALTEDESGIYFTAAGFLWKYTGRSFHPIAEPAGTVESLLFDNGNCYLSTGTRLFFNNTVTRPDITAPGSTNVETGYWISSRLDFHKVNVSKLLKLFELQTRFSTASDAGSVTLYYKIDDGGPDPGVSGGSGGTGWTTIGTLSQGDDNPATYLLTNAISARAIWLRAKLTPGASGYPYLVYVTTTGRSLMPVQRRFQAHLMLKTGTVDQSGDQIYDSLADIEQAISDLQDLRYSQDSFDIIWDDGSTSGETIEVTMAALSIIDLGNRNADGATYKQAIVVFDELPTIPVALAS